MGLFDSVGDLGTKLNEGVDKATSGLDKFEKKVEDYTKKLTGAGEADRRKEEIERAEKESQGKAEERYKKESLDITALKKQYSDALMRNLQQQTAGFGSAITSQRGMNPALAAHLIGSTASEMGANAAGIGALKQEEIGSQAEMYNKQLMANLKQQEYAKAMGQAQYVNEGDQLFLNNIRNLVASGGNSMMTLMAAQTGGGSAAMAGAGQAMSTGPGAGQPLPSRYGLGLSSAPGGGQSMANPFTPPQYQDIYSDVRLKTADYNPETHHMAYAGLLTGDHGDNIRNQLKSNDELKTPSKIEMQKFESSLEPKKYYYKAGSKADDGGEAHTGPIAQNIEKSSIGKNIVKEDSEGMKTLDLKGLTTGLASSIYDLNERLKKMEKRRSA